MSLVVNAQLPQPAYRPGLAQTVYALIDFTPAATLARLPLDLRLVLDHSGSMEQKAGARSKQTKIALLREAANKMLEALQPGDHAQIVCFSDAARTLWEGSIRGEQDRQAAQKAVSALVSAGGTSILAGLEAATAAPPLPGHVARLVLVTDGEGGADEESPSAALAFDQRGKAAWLVYGTGVGYNDAFLDALASASGGQYTHLADMQQAVQDFGQAVAVMGEVAISGLLATLEPLNGCALTRVDRIVPQVLALPVHQASYMSADLGDVDKLRGQKLLVQLAVPALAIGTHALLRVKCGFHVPALKQINQQVECLVEATFSLDAPTEPDPEVLRTVQLAGASRLYTLGLAEAANGQGDAAVRTLGSATGLYEDLGLVSLSARLQTLTTSLSHTGTLDEDVKRTLTTLARRSADPDAP